MKFFFLQCTDITWPNWKLVVEQDLTFKKSYQIYQILLLQSTFYKALHSLGVTWLNVEANIVGGDLRGLNGSHWTSHLTSWYWLDSYILIFTYDLPFIQGSALTWHNVTKRGSKHSWQGFKRVKQVTKNIIGLLILIKFLPIDFYFRFVFLQGTELTWHNVTKCGSEHSWRGFRRVKRVTLNITFNLLILIMILHIDFYFWFALFTRHCTNLA